MSLETQKIICGRLGQINQIEERSDGDVFGPCLITAHLDDLSPDLQQQWIWLAFLKKYLPSVIIMFIYAIAPMQDQRIVIVISYQTFSLWWRCAELQFARIHQSQRIFFLLNIWHTFYLGNTYAFFLKRLQHMLLNFDQWLLRIRKPIPELDRALGARQASVPAITQPSHLVTSFHPSTLV